MSQPTAPVGDSLSPEQLNALIQLPPPPPGEQPLPYHNPEAGRVQGAATPQSIEETLAALPTASAAGISADADPDAALRQQLEALKGELTDLLDGQERRAADPAAVEYVFENNNLAGWNLLTLPDKTTYMMKFAPTPVVRHGRLSQRGVWRSSRHAEDFADDPGRLEAVVKALKRSEDWRNGVIKDQQHADAEELTREMSRLRGAIQNVKTGHLPSQFVPNVNTEEGLRAVPQIAKGVSLPR